MISPQPPMAPNPPVAHHSPRSPLESPSAPYTPIRLNSPCTAPYSPISLPAAPSSHRPTLAPVLGGCRGSGGTGSSAGGVGGGWWGPTARMLAAALWRWGTRGCPKPTAHPTATSPTTHPNPTVHSPTPRGFHGGREGRAGCLGPCRAPLPVPFSRTPPAELSSALAPVEPRLPARCCPDSSGCRRAFLRGGPGCRERRFAEESRACNRRLPTAAPAHSSSANGSRRSCR